METEDILCLLGRLWEEGKFRKRPGTLDGVREIGHKVLVLVLVNILLL